MQNPGVQELGRRGPGYAEPRPVSHGLRGRTREEKDFLRDSGQAGDSRGRSFKRIPREKLRPEKRQLTRKKLSRGPYCKDRGEVLDKSLD